MTKVGEGKNPPKQPTIELYHKEVELNASKFLNALESYKDAKGEDRNQLKAIMDQCLQLIRAAVGEIRLGGIHKQEVLVEKDYQTYMASQKPDDLSALEEDLSTLREYNKLT